jgi:hypothetical protein
MQKVRQKISVIKTNTFDDIKKVVHFGILIPVKTAKTQVFVMITEIICDELFDVINDDPEFYQNSSEGFLSHSVFRVFLL